MLLQKKSAKSLGAAPTFELSRTSANYIGPFSTNSLISMIINGNLGLRNAVISGVGPANLSGKKDKLNYPRLHLQKVIKCAPCLALILV
jgi:hypothetical protein